jgi:hypothetical protein
MNLNLVAKQASMEDEGDEQECNQRLELKAVCTNVKFKSDFVDFKCTSKRESTSRRRWRPRFLCAVNCV